MGFRTSCESMLLPPLLLLLISKSRLANGSWPLRHFMREGSPGNLQAGNSLIARGWGLGVGVRGVGVVKGEGVGGKGEGGRRTPIWKGRGCSSYCSGVKVWFWYRSGCQTSDFNVETVPLRGSGVSEVNFRDRIKLLCYKMRASESVGTFYKKLEHALFSTS